MHQDVQILARELASMAPENRVRLKNEINDIASFFKRTGRTLKRLSVSPIASIDQVHADDDGSSAASISEKLRGERSLRTIIVRGRRTTVRVERKIWCLLERLAAQRLIGIEELIDEIENWRLVRKPELPRASAIRLYAVICACGFGNSGLDYTKAPLIKSILS